MKIVKYITIFIILVAPVSCKKYLDLVPDNTLKLEDIFNLREDAWNALAKVYSYMPKDGDVHATTWTLGDEWIGRLDYNDNTGLLRAMRIMRGLQSQSSPQLGLWSGTQGGRPMYQAIRQADVFLANIDNVRDMTNEERSDWKAQVTMLKAYYMFLLVERYGPIVIPDKIAQPETPTDELFLPRSKVEDCFTYILNLINQSIPLLDERAGENEAGQIDQIVAKAIKARILFFRASPFFNGNREYYGDFVNEKGEPFFPQQYDSEKWKAAIDALNDAIAIAETNGRGLYTFDKVPYLFDRSAFEKNAANMQKLYDLRMLIVDPWNKEVVWGNSNIDYYGGGEIPHGSNMRLPEGYGDGVINDPGFSWQWLGATYQMAERYYTKNGLPIEEDLTFNMSTRQNITRTPGDGTAEYEPLRGIMQPNTETINLYLNREPRFYANLAITGGYWRTHTVRINTIMYANRDGGFNSSQHTTDYFATGIGVKKFVHPESQSGAWQRTVKYPYPIIRMADLYLMKAEALNEYSGPSAQVYAEINKIRRRAGIPDIETVWANANLCRTPGKHLTKEGLRDIILQERSVEFAFEGQHYWDMIRHKRAPAVFSAPIWGWNHAGTNGQDFFRLQVKQERRFTINDCLTPIDLNEMNTNGKLIQNPGW